MDLVLFSAIPKVALFFLLLVGLAILAEIIYLAKKKLDSHEVTLPKSLQNLPPQAAPAMVAVTTEVVSETPKKGRLTRKTTMVILSTLLIALTIPVGLALVKQRQVVEKQAFGGSISVTNCQVSSGQTSCQTAITWNFEADYNTNYALTANGNTIRNFWHVPTRKDNEAVCLSDCPPEGIGCGYPACKSKQEGSINFNMECKTYVFKLIDLDGMFEKANVQAQGTGCQAATPTPTPTPTPPAFTIQCQGANAFDSNWNAITNLNSITVGQAVYFTVNGQTNEPGGLTKARFTINGGTPIETTTKHGTDFYIQYTIATAGPYTVQGEVFNPALGWK